MLFTSSSELKELLCSRAYRTHRLVVWEGQPVHGSEWAECSEIVGESGDTAHRHKVECSDIKLIAKIYLLGKKKSKCVEK